jgi:copper chaperone CopZ
MRTGTVRKEHREATEPMHSARQADRAAHAAAAGPGSGRRLTMPLAVVRTELEILGMKDKHCPERLYEALASVEGVLEVRSDYYRSRVYVVHDWSCPRARLVDAAVGAGYGAAVAMN